MRVYVLAESFEQYADWCNRNQVNPVAGICVLDAGTLRGNLTPSDRVFDARPVKAVIEQRQRVA
jgi:hypothetical protein